MPQHRTPDGLFRHLEVLASEGSRAPFGEAPLYRALALMGKIRYEVSGHNWRQVEILVGPHAGKKTLANPHGHRVYLVVDADGLHRLQSVTKAA